MKSLQVAWVLFAGLGIGCSHSSANLPGGGAGAGGSGGTSGAAGMGGAGGSGGMAGAGGMGGNGGTGGSGGALPTSFTSWGELTIGWAGTNQIAALFSQSANGMPSGSATVVGPCILLNLPDGAGQISAGTITITDSVGAETLTPDAQGRYKTVSPPLKGTRWQMGDALTIAASGAAFPAFSVQATIPTDSFFMTSWSSGVPANVPRDTDLTLQWSGGSGTFVGEFSSLADPAGRSLVCSFPAADGHGVVPSAALSLLPAGATDFSFDNADVTRMNDNGAYLRVSADVLQLQNQGMPFAITLQ